MKKLLRAVTAMVMALVLSVMLLVPAFGAELKTVSLDVHRGINLYVNCTPFMPTDINGNETYPFLYNGTTYVPLRAVSTMLGATLEWDNAKKQVNEIARWLNSSQSPPEFTGFQACGYRKEQEGP